MAILLDKYSPSLRNLPAPAQIVRYQKVASIKIYQASVRYDNHEINQSAYLYSHIFYSNCRYDIMLTCWNQSPSSRPSFKELETRLVDEPLYLTSLPDSHDYYNITDTNMVVGDEERLLIDEEGNVFQ